MSGPPVSLPGSSLSTDPSASPGGFLAPRPESEPQSHCIRCGKPTPAGVSLCEVDNPGKIMAPSATQVHGTMLLGVIVGVIGFLLLARLAVGHNGPFLTQVTGATTLADGTVQAVIHVVNQGSSAVYSTCRVTRDGSPRPDDLVFRTDRIPAGGSEDVNETLPLSVDPTVPAYDPGTLTIACT